MNRNFRGIGINTDKWVYGDYCTVPSPNILFINKNNEVDCEPVEIETVGQDTGLKDKKLNKIYEGDIVIPRYNGFSAFEVKFVKGKYNVADFRTDECEIIGNVFLNSDLLED